MRAVGFVPQDELRVGIANTDPELPPRSPMIENHGAEIVND